MRRRPRTSKNLLLISLLLAGILVASVPLSVASTRVGATPAGFWRGAIEVPDAAIEVAIDIIRSDGGWQAVVFVPGQGIRAVDMIDVIIEGGSVRCGIPGVPGQPTFVGHLSEDGLTLAGHFSQGGRSLPFRLTRGDKPQEFKEDVYAVFEQPGAIGSGLAGIWRGVLESAPHRFRLVLHLAQRTDGSLAGTIDTLDQNAEGLPLDGVEVDNRSISFTLSPVGAAFRGRLSDDGAELTGQWRQGSQVLSLTFRRGAR